MQGIYLDNSSSAAPSRKAISAMMPFLTEQWGSFSSPHQGGNVLVSAVETAYKQIYSFLGASEDDTFIFTSSGAEAVNQVFQTVYQQVAYKTDKKHFIVSSIDEAPALMCVAKLEELGCVGTMMEPDANGRVLLAALEQEINEETALVSLSWGNGMTGSLQDAAAISALCKRKGVLLHLDATHVLGKLYFDLSEIQADYLTFSGEPLHALKGTGGLLVRNKAPIAPLILGGIEQAGLRAGQVNVPLLVGFGEACHEAQQNRDYVCTEIARLRNKLEQNMLQHYPNTKLFLQHSERLPHISVMAFPPFVNETLLYLLNRKKVMACIGGGSFQQLAIVMESCQVPAYIAHSCISFSLSTETTEDDIDQTVDRMANILQQLKKTALQ